MEKLFFVEDGNLDEVNEILAKGGEIKIISTAGKSVASGSDFPVHGNVCAYIVIQMPEK